MVQARSKRDDMNDHFVSKSQSIIVFMSPNAFFEHTKKSLTIDGPIILVVSINTKEEGKDTRVSLRHLTVTVGSKMHPSQSLWYGTIP